MAQTTARARPFYAPLAGGSDSETSIPLTAPLVTETARQRRRRRRQQRRQRAARPPPAGGVRALLPSARRFWADFTLGFADGLTVPFALTAGLSSLGGRTDTVVYAGMAEVSAGCISMGIGGYLSARPAASAASAAAVAAAASPLPPMAEQKEQLRRRDPEAAAASETPRQRLLAPAADTTAAAIAERYLAPLGLPHDLHRRAVAHVVAAGPQRARALQMAYDEMADEDDEEADDDDEDDNGDGDKDEDEPVWPVAAGLSVALGYLVGGLLPLGPYFATASVGDGLRWSFAVCLVALFGFGFARDFFLEGPGAPADDDDVGVQGDADDDYGDGAAARREKARPRLPWTRRRRVPWQRLRKSAGEGLQMVVLGGIAAVAAVLCVRLFESGSDGSDGSGGGDTAP